VIKGRPPRLPLIFQSRDAPLFFVTMCTLHRQSFPSLDSTHNAFVAYARRAEHFNIAVGRYVIMPDHVHFFVCGGAEFVLGDWIKGLKRSIHNALPRPRPERLWQPGFFDHLLRSDESYAEKWTYVRDNPVRAGFATTAAAWPYAGEIIHIDRA
jgi:REP element-mobilizing transposase RayT